LASGVLQTTYTATGLTYGLVYKFKVEAQNGFGYSDFSEEISILCASFPEKPNAPTTSVI